MEMNKRGRERGAQGTGRNAPRLQAIPGASSFPRRRESRPLWRGAASLYILIAPAMAAKAASPRRGAL